MVPAVDVFDRAVLDTAQALAQLHGDGAGLIVVYGELTVAAQHAPDRSDHRCGTACKRLTDGAVFSALVPLLHRDLALLGAVAEVFRNLQQRFAGDASQEGTGQCWGDQLRVLPAALDEHEVHAAHLFDVLALNGVEPDNLVAALFFCLGLREQGTRVVASELGVTGAAGRRADVFLGDPHADGLDAAGEVGASWGCNEVIGVGARGLHPERLLGANHKWTQVQRRFPASFGDPVLINRHQLLQRLDEQILRQLRHCQAMRGMGKTRRILLGAERRDRAVVVAVCLQAFEDRLPVVEDVSRRVQRDRPVRADLRVMPAVGLVPVDGDHVVSKLLPEGWVCEHCIALFVSCLVRIRDNFKWCALSHADHPTPRFHSLEPEFHIFFHAQIACPAPRVPYSRYPWRCSIILRKAHVLMTFSVPESLLPVRGDSVSLNFSTSAPSDTAALLLPVTSDDSKVEVPVTSLAPKGALEALETVGAKGTAGEITRVVVDGKLVIAFGLGNADEIDDETVRRAVGSLARTLYGTESAVISTEFGVAPVVEGLLLGAYKYKGFKAPCQCGCDGEHGLTDVTVVGKDDEKEAFDQAVILAESVMLARDLVNTPSNHLYPAVYAELIENVGKQVELEVEVFDEKQLEEQGFGGILAVGKGSARAPRLVHLKWTPSASKSSVALVGKGITFDTGGISLKPGAKMEDMISDMGGSAAQFGAIVAAARLNLDVAVDAWLPLAENMPSGTATRPGDVIRHYGGITSEVLNTDAEGRLVLADAMARAAEDNPDFMIETSTLTGAQLVALGNRTAGVMGSDEFRDRVAALGREVGEQAWAMPLLEEQEEELKSPVADIRNVHNARTGGMLFAGLYLSRFVGEDTEWVHIDVAGPAWNGGSPRGYTPKRATGAPLRTIVATLRSIAEAN